MLCKNLRSEVHGRTVLLAWVPDRHRLCVSGLCVFSIPRVFYHCPTTSATPVSKNTCRPGRKFFFLFYQDRPCVYTNAVPATLDYVHRVTVLCDIVLLCSTRFYCAVPLCCVGLLLCALCVLCVLSAVLVYPHYNIT